MPRIKHEPVRIRNKAHNKIELDHAYVLDQWRRGRSSDCIAKEFNVTQIVILRHLKEATGDQYANVLKEHWLAIGSKRALSRAGKKTKGGGRWFTSNEEESVVTLYLNSTLSYEELATHFKCSRAVIKKLIARKITKVDRKKRSSPNTGKKLVQHIPIECLHCKKTFEVPPWIHKTGKRYCSVRCKGKDLSGKRSSLYGKVHHAVGGWYVVDGVKMWLRSQWEFAVANYLNSLNKKWEYENKTFPIEIGGKHATYTPDFYLPDENVFIEVKGYWRPAYIAKHEAFSIRYPNVKIEIWDKPKLRELGLIKMPYVKPGQ